MAFEAPFEVLNADFSKRVVMETAAMEWQASPSPSVWRKRLDLLEGEYGRVTSVVRYDAGSRFHSHGHPEGEEILVLEGVFSDEHGDYPAGTYLLNPPGFEHAPFSKEGCRLFVKLYQYGGAARTHVATNTARAAWEPGPAPGVQQIPLYFDEAHPESVRLLRFAPGARLPEYEMLGGEEIFVLEGAFEDGQGSYPKGAWLRNPPGGRHALASKKGCRLYVKSGHLGA